jgi:hypothetical protein
MSPRTEAESHRKPASAEHLAVTAVLTGAIKETLYIYHSCAFMLLMQTTHLEEAIVL